MHDVGCIMKALRNAVNNALQCFPRTDFLWATDLVRMYILRSKSVVVGSCGDRKHWYIGLYPGRVILAIGVSTTY